MILKTILMWLLLAGCAQAGMLSDIYLKGAGAGERCTADALTNMIKNDLSVEETLLAIEECVAEELKAFLEDDEDEEVSKI